jgi:CBS domain-containing protein
MKAKDVMTPGVITVQPDTPILTAVRLMLQKKISGLPVVSETGELVGMVTEGDFLRRSEIGTQRTHPRWLEFLLGPGSLATDYVHASGRKVGEVMTPEVRNASEDTSLADLVALMERYHIKRVPVVRNTKLVGIVTRANLLRALVALAREAAPSQPGDAAIRDKIVAELKKQPWAPTGLVDVIVRNGVVQLCGSVLDERQRAALRVAAENVAGVKKIEDHLVWIEPMSGMAIESEEDRKSEALQS